MTSTIEKTIDTLSIAINHVNAVFATGSNEQKDKLAFVNHLLRLQQGSLISYVECIREKRRQARKNRNKNMSIMKSYFIQKM